MDAQFAAFAPAMSWGWARVGEQGWSVRDAYLPDSGLSATKTVNAFFPS
jgi:hypothetical protein